MFNIDDVIVGYNAPRVSSNELAKFLNDFDAAVNIFRILFTFHIGNDVQLIILVTEI